MTQAEINMIVQAAVAAALAAIGQAPAAPAGPVNGPGPEETEETSCDWVGTIGGRERFARLTGTRTATGFPIYEVVGDECPPQGERAPEYVDGVLKELPLTLNGARFFLRNGAVMANMLKNRPWKGVYHVYAYTDNPYTVLREDDELQKALYGTLPDEPPAVTTGPKQAAGLSGIEKVPSGGNRT